MGETSGGGGVLPAALPVHVRLHKVEQATADHSEEPHRAALGSSGLEESGSLLQTGSSASIEEAISGLRGQCTHHVRECLQPDDLPKADLRASQPSVNAPFEPR